MATKEDGYMEYMIGVEDIRLQVYERGNRRSEIMIVFLHGGPGSGAKAIMELEAFQLLEKQYHCIYFDQRGSGRSLYDLRKGLSKAVLAHDVEMIIQDSKRRWKPTYIALWGGSFGGALACLANEICSLQMDCLLLSNPAICFSREQSLSLFHRMRKPMMQRLGIQDSMDETIPPEIWMQEKAFVSFVHSNQNPSNSLRHIQAMSSWFFLHDYHNALSSIEVPCLVLNGKEDPICDCQATIDAIGQLDNEWIYWHVLSPCGHAVFQDQKEEFVTYTSKFIQNVL